MSSSLQLCQKKRWREGWREPGPRGAVKAWEEAETPTPCRVTKQLSGGRATCSPGPVLLVETGARSGDLGGAEAAPWPFTPPSATQGDRGTEPPGLLQMGWEGPRDPFTENHRTAIRLGEEKSQEVDLSPTPLAQARAALSPWPSSRQVGKNGVSCPTARGQCRCDSPGKDESPSLAPVWPGRGDPSLATPGPQILPLQMETKTTQLRKSRPSSACGFQAKPGGPWPHNARGHPSHA